MSTLEFTDISKAKSFLQNADIEKFIISHLGRKAWVDTYDELAYATHMTLDDINNDTRLLSIIKDNMNEFIDILDKTDITYMINSSQLNINYDLIIRFL